MHRTHLSYRALSAASGLQGTLSFTGIRFQWLGALMPTGGGCTRLNEGRVAMPRQGAHFCLPCNAFWVKLALVSVHKWYALTIMLSASCGRTGTKPLA